MLNCEHLQCCMIAFETMLNAKMHAALGTNVGGSYASVWLVTAHGTVPSPLCMRQVMILDQRHRSIGSSACPHSLPIGSEQLHQGMHELFSEIELPRSMLADCPELEGIDDAHIQQPPCETRPGLLAPPSYQVGVVQLIAHVNGASAIEVVSDGARAADGNLVARVVPALQRCGLVRRAVVVEHPHGFLIAPHRNCGVALLPLDPLALTESRHFLVGDGGHSLAIPAHRAAAADASLLQLVEDSGGSEPIVSEEDVLLLLVLCSHPHDSLVCAAQRPRLLLLPLIHFEVQQVVVTGQAVDLV